MKNLKKYLAVLVVVAMMITTLVPVLAEPMDTFQYSNEATKLHVLGLFSGVSTSTFDPALDLNVDRETGVVLVLKLLGLEDTAISTYTNLDGSTNTTNLNADLANCADVNSIDAWAQKQVAYAIKIGIISGESIMGNGRFYFNPKGLLTGNAFATMVLKNLGYGGQFAYGGALNFLAGKSSSSSIIQNISDWAETSLTRDQLVGLSYYVVLAATFANSSETTVIQNLLNINKVTWQEIQDTGLITDLGNVATESVAISSVTATNDEQQHTQLTVVFDSDIVDTLVSNNFKVIRSIQGIPSLMQDEVTVGGYYSTTHTVVLDVTPITPANINQIITYSVMYKGGTAVNATLTDLVVDSVSNTTLGHVKVVFNQEVDKAIAEDKTNYTLTSISISNAALQSDNKTAILTLAANLASGTNYTLTIKNGKSKDLSKTITNNAQTFTASTNLTVNSISATNLKQVNVVFSEEVYETTAEIVSNYFIPGINIDSAVLQTDIKTVVLNLNQDTILSQNTDYTVTINNVKNISLSKTIADDSELQTFTAQDNIHPTVQSVEVIGTKRLRVVFSEPIKTVNADNFSFEGEPDVQVSSLTQNAGIGDWTTVTLGLDGALAVGTHGLSIKNNLAHIVRDFAGNPIDDSTTSITVTDAEIQPPIVQNVQLASNTKVWVTFSKPVKNVTKSNIHWFYNSGVGTIADSVTEVDDITYIANFTSTPVPNDAYIMVTAVGINGPIEDYSGNEMSSDSNYSTLNVTSADMPTTTRIIVRFNKDIDNITATDVGNYTLLHADGMEIPLTQNDTTFTIDSINHTIAIDVAAQLSEERYTLEISGIKDTSGIEMLQPQIFELQTPAKMLGAALIDSTHIDLIFNIPVVANNADLQKSIIVSTTNMTSIGFKLVDVNGDKIDNVTAKTIHLKLKNGVDITESVNVRTTEVDFKRLADENGHIIQTNNIIGFEASQVFEATSINVNQQATYNNDGSVDGYLETLVIKFNKNIDLTTIKSGWIDAKGAQQTILNIDANGMVSLNGIMPGNDVRLGTITGFAQTNISAAATITSDGSNTITIAITRQAGTRAIFVSDDNGLTYSPYSGITSVNGMSINTDYQPVLEV